MHTFIVFEVDVAAMGLIPTDRHPPGNVRHGGELVFLAPCKPIAIVNPVEAVQDELCALPDQHTLARESALALVHLIHTVQGLALRRFLGHHLVGVLVALHQLQIQDFRAQPGVHPDVGFGSVAERPGAARFPQLTT
jgi:hypothetical protein